MAAVRTKGAVTVGWGGACPQPGPGSDSLPALSAHRPRCLRLQRGAPDPGLLPGRSGEDRAVHVYRR